MVSQGKAPRYLCHLGRIFLKMPAISLLTGPPWGATWQMFNLTLTPSAAAECEAIAFGSDPAIDCGGGAGAASHVCLRCAGELRFGLAPIKDSNPCLGAHECEINVGYVSLMPGPWGRLADKSGKPLPVLKSGADLLTAMGVTTMRSGGSVSQSMRWKDWRGPQLNRPSVGQIWGKSFLAGWGPFEARQQPPCFATAAKPQQRSS